MKMRVKIEPAAAVMLTALLLTDRTGLAVAALLAAAVHETGHLCAAPDSKRCLGDSAFSAFWPTPFSRTGILFFPAS